MIPHSFQKISQFFFFITMAEQQNGMNLNGRKEQFTSVLESKVNGKYRSVTVNANKILIHIRWKF